MANIVRIVSNKQSDVRPLGFASSIASISKPKDLLGMGTGD